MVEVSKLRNILNTSIVSFSTFLEILFLIRFRLLFCNFFTSFNIVKQNFLTGLRLGELTGLKKKFLLQYMVKVRNTLKRLKVFSSSTEWHWETKLIKPKSDSSIRNVNFPIPFWAIFERARGKMEKERLRI